VEKHPEELVQIVRRHGPRAVDADGSKLDDITEPSLRQAYDEGLHLKEQYPFWHIQGSHSGKIRTKRTVGAWLAGVYGIDFNEFTEVNPDEYHKRFMDRFSHNGALHPCFDYMTPEQIEAASAIPNEDKKMRYLFEEGNDVAVKTGKSLALFLARELSENRRRNDRVNVCVTHGGTIEPAYYLLLGKPINIETADEVGYFGAGEGFSISHVSGRNVLHVHRHRIGNPDSIAVADERPVRTTKNAIFRNIMRYCY